MDGYYFEEITILTFDTHNLLLVVQKLHVCTETIVLDLTRCQMENIDMSAPV